jgi:hypothetical protein
VIELRTGTKIWLAAGVTDMRRGFDGLSAQVQTILEIKTTTRGPGTFSGSSRFTFGHAVRGNPATRSGKRSHETPDRELLAWTQGIVRRPGSTGLFGSKG